MSDYDYRTRTESERDAFIKMLKSGDLVSIAELGGHNSENYTRLAKYAKEAGLEHIGVEMPYYITDRQGHLIKDWQVPKDVDQYNVWDYNKAKDDPRILALENLNKQGIKTYAYDTDSAKAYSVERGSEGYNARVGRDLLWLSTGSQHLKQDLMSEGAMSSRQIDQFLNSSSFERYNNPYMQAMLRARERSVQLRQIIWQIG